MPGPAPVKASNRSSPAVSATAVAKSGRVLYAFSLFYLPFYDRDTHYLFDQYGLFAYMSALVYDIDEGVELGDERAARRLRDLERFLSERAELDAAIIRLLDDAREYYRFEHDVSHRDLKYSLDDLARVTAVRSFDFRLMHRVLSQQCGKCYCEELFAWFRPFEMLMELEDDMLSVREDWRRGTFNVVCLAMKEAPSAATSFVETFRVNLEREVAQRMMQLPERERGTCVRTLASYREVVRRVKLPGAWAAQG